MLKIKLSPFGRKHERHFRIVVTEERSKLTGTSVATLGHYHPLSKQIVLDKDAYQHWISKGAQPTAKIRKLARA